ncbi:hypothetical protein FQZ97_1119020 [compost metagenome]
MPRGDAQAQPELLEQAPLHVLQVGEALDVLQPLQQALLFLAGQQQDARVAGGVLQQRVAPAVAGAGRAGLAGGKRGCHGLRA